MHVFPGKPLSIRVEFEVGGDPVSPTAAAYEVIDRDHDIVVPSTSITPPIDKWIVVPDTAHVALATGEKFRQLRMDVSFTADGGVFEKYYVYYVVPDLFLTFDNSTARLTLGISGEEYASLNIDYYQAYIDLATSEIGDEFYTAITGTDQDQSTLARNLVYYAALRTVLPVMQLSTYKSIESETSKVTRFDMDFEKVNTFIEQQYQLYYAQIKVLGTPNVAPTFLVLDAPTDAITGV